MSFFRSIKLFRVAGIPLELHSTFLLLIIFAAYQGWVEYRAMGAVWMVSLILMAFVCVVLHELGHSLTARNYGIKIERILLLPIGGIAQFHTIPRKPAVELVITIAGPLVNFVIAGLLAGVFHFFLGWPIHFERTLMTYTPYSLILGLLVFNIVMGLFNLLPVFPMDGGRILRALLALKLPYLKATKYAVRVSQPLAFICLCLALYNGALFATILFAILLIGSNAELKQVENFDPFEEMSIGEIVDYDFSSLNASDPVESLDSMSDEDRHKTFLVLDKGYVLGALKPIDISQEVLNNSQILRDLPIQRTAPVQAEWPVSLLSEKLLHQYGTFIPVYHSGELIGIIDLEKLRERKLNALKQFGT